MAAAPILALAISALAAPADPQMAVSASLDADSTQEIKGSGVIRGRITSLDTGKPLRRAQVRLTIDELIPSPPRTASTSNDGRYEFRDIPPGRYTLRVERSGYLALTYGQRRPGEQGRPLEIAAKEVADKVDFALPRMGVISGRVFDDLGEPIAGVTVWVLQTRYIQGRRQLVATGANATTDITGRYRLLSLTPGDYAVMGTTRETWPHESDPKQVFGYASTYFPGTSTAAQARRVKLGVAQQASGIDFSLVAGRTSTVRGTATSASGLPLGGETVTMMREIGGSTMWMGSAVAVGSAKVAGDGSWTLSNIPPGEYRLSIRAAARGDDPAQEGQITTTVAGGDVEGLALVAGAGGTVRGEVVTDDGSPLPAGFDRMQVRPPFTPNARMMISVLHPDNGRVQSDGSFGVHGVLSDTVLSIGPLTGDWTLKAIEVEGRDMADLPLPIEHGKRLSGVRIVLTNRPTTIRGALRDEKLNPVGGTVIVFAEDSAKWREGSRAIRTTRGDERGLFTFKGLPAGDYFLAALDSVQDAQWYDPDFLEGLKGRARRVAIADAESKQVDLVLRK
ncbi:MAG: carboxypeptidase-like regulatory domain-containing protein [Vicinamibacterales bacterium]